MGGGIVGARAGAVDAVEVEGHDPQCGNARNRVGRRVSGAEPPIGPAGVGKGQLDVEVPVPAGFEGIWPVSMAGEVNWPVLTGDENTSSAGSSRGSRLKYHRRTNSASVNPSADNVNVSEPGEPPSSKVAFSHGGVPAGATAPLYSKSRSIDKTLAPTGEARTATPAPTSKNHLNIYNQPLPLLLHTPTERM